MIKQVLTNYTERCPNLNTNYKYEIHLPLMLDRVLPVDVQTQKCVCGVDTLTEGVLGYKDILPVCED
jgi:hypothetical protein